MMSNKQVIPRRPLTFFPQAVLLPLFLFKPQITSIKTVLITKLFQSEGVTSYGFTFDAFCVFSK